MMKMAERGVDITQMKQKNYIDGAEKKIMNEVVKDVI